MKNQDKYKIISTVKKQTAKGNNYFDIEAEVVATGEIVNCVYFGNTVPKRLVDIVERETENGIYQMAIIQPHTSRDKKTGKFTNYKRVGSHI